MGAWGAIIMGFFGAVFAALTLHWQWGIADSTLACPFFVFVLIALGAARVIALPGKGITPSDKVQQAISRSTIAEGIALGVTPLVLVNLHQFAIMLPVMALIVGLHFLPIAAAESFRPFYILGFVLIACALAGLIIKQPLGGQLAGVVAAVSLWMAAVIAVRRDWQERRMSLSAG